MERIPLFPLRTVLFPGMPLPLRVFERRYHAMLRDCEAQGRGFGVVLIREGPEVGGFAVPREVGCVAEVEARSDQGGQAFLLARGTRRFRVLRTRRERAWLEAEVEWLPEPEPGEPPHGPDVGHGHGHMPVEAEVAALFGDYLDLVGAVTRVPVDDDVAALLEGRRRADAWGMACAIAGALHVLPEEKQVVLESARVHDALHVEQALLGRETARLRAILDRLSAKLN